MPQDKPRLSRLTSILTQLQSKSLVTATELAEKYSVSVRTIYRDIRTLESSGIPIITEEGKGYSILEGYKIPPVMFTEEEANALITAEQIINNNTDKSFTELYKSATTKIKAVLKHSQKEKTELLSKRLHVKKANYKKPESNHLIDLQTAVTNFSVVNLNYRSLEGKESSRNTEPFALYSTNENWILIAFCLLRNEFRSFRLDCIQGLEILDSSFEPHDLTLQDYFENWKKYSTTPDIPMTSPPTTFESNETKSKMKKTKVEAFKIIGISVRTSNVNGKAAQDIPALWQKFMAQETAKNIPNLIDESAYAVYTNYEGDHMKPYDTIIGCKVSSLDKIPDGMVGHEITGGTYAEFLSKGDLMQGAVISTWTEIWNTPDLKRVYSSDFELYDQRAKDMSNAEVPILVAINS